VSFDYGKSAATALKLLQKFGRTVTHTRQVSGNDYNPSTGAATVTPSNQTGTGCVLDFQLMNYGTTFEGQTVIQQGDKYALLATSGITNVPVPGDLFVAGGVTWNIMGVKTVSPAGTDVLHKLHLRK
jgi:hypothetical protein